MNNEYHREYQRNRYAENKVWALSILGGCCVKCGSTTALEFDHIDPKYKSFNVTTGLSKRSRKVLLEELDKCQLLCRICHEARTKIQLKGRPSPMKGKKLR